MHSSQSPLSAQNTDYQKICSKLNQMLLPLQPEAKTLDYDAFCLIQALQDRSKEVIPVWIDLSEKKIIQSFYEKALVLDHNADFLKSCVFVIRSEQGFYEVPAKQAEEKPVMRHEIRIGFVGLYLLLYQGLVYDADLGRRFINLHEQFVDDESVTAAKAYRIDVIPPKFDDFSRILELATQVSRKKWRELTAIASFQPQQKFLHQARFYAKLQNAFSYNVLIRQIHDGLAQESMLLAAHYAAGVSQDPVKVSQYVKDNKDFIQQSVHPDLRTMFQVTQQGVAVQTNASNISYLYYNLFYLLNFFYLASALNKVKGSRTSPSAKPMLAEQHNTPLKAWFDKWVKQVDFDEVLNYELRTVVEVFRRSGLLYMQLQSNELMINHDVFLKITTHTVISPVLKEFFRLVPGIIENTVANASLAERPTEELLRRDLNVATYSLIHIPEERDHKIDLTSSLIENPSPLFLRLMSATMLMHYAKYKLPNDSAVLLLHYPEQRYVPLCGYANSISTSAIQHDLSVERSFPNSSRLDSLALPGELPAQTSVAMKFRMSTNVRRHRGELMDINHLDYCMYVLAEVRDHTLKLRLLNEPLVLTKKDRLFLRRFEMSQLENQFPESSSLYLLLTFMKLVQEKIVSYRPVVNGHSFVNGFIGIFIGHFLSDLFVVGACAKYATPSLGAILRDKQQCYLADKLAAVSSSWVTGLNPTELARILQEPQLASLSDAEFYVMSTVLLQGLDVLSYDAKLESASRDAVSIDLDYYEVMRQFNAENMIKQILYKRLGNCKGILLTSSSPQAHKKAQEVDAFFKRYDKDLPFVLIVSDKWKVLSRAEKEEILANPAPYTQIHYESFKSVSSELINESKTLLPISAEVSQPSGIVSPQGLARPSPSRIGSFSGLSVHPPASVRFVSSTSSIFTQVSSEKEHHGKKRRLSSSALSHDDSEMLDEGGDQLSLSQYSDNPAPAPSSPRTGM